MAKNLRANKMAPQIAGVLLWLAGSVLGLRDVQVSVPEAVGIGSSAILGCRWALETGETLYTVKWYHGAQEFFRFVPKELPNTRVFYQTGINVDIYRSGAHQVVLRDATRGLSGRYRCEVSADAPFFHTVYKTALLKVVELPVSGPRVQAQKTWYSVGDMLRANCSSSPSDPPSNLTWLLNGREVKGLDIPLYEIETRSVIKDTSLENANKIIFSPWDAVRGYETTETQLNALQKRKERDSRIEEDNATSSIRPALLDYKSSLNSEEEKSNKTSSFSQLIMRVQSSHFRKGRLNVTCVARVFSIWSASRVLMLDEERPYIAPVMGSRDSSTGSRQTGYFSLLKIIMISSFLLVNKGSLRWILLEEIFSDLI